MEQIHHMSLSGHAETIPLTVAAHAHLVRYLSNTRAALGTDPDADETVRDLETTLGDRLRSMATTPGAAIDDEQLARILTETGSVEQEAPSTRILASPARGRFFCRIKEGSWFGGLCAGIATYGDFRVDWVRTIALFLLLFTGGTAGLVYLALLLILPKVDTVTEYQRQCSEPVPSR
jgi:phage shock protein PspC (stress-responsive transcriptional regulator)